MFVMRDFFCLNSLNKFQELCTKACGVKIKCVILRHLMDGYTTSMTSVHTKEE